MGILVVTLCGLNAPYVVASIRKTILGKQMPIIGNVITVSTTKIMKPQIPAIFWHLFISSIAPDIQSQITDVQQARL